MASPSKQNLSVRLKRVEQSLELLLQSDSCDQVCRAQKQVSRELLHLVKWERFHALGLEDQALLLGCMRKLAVLVKSTAYEVYGQRFSFFWFVMTRYGLKKIQELYINPTNTRTYKRADSFHYAGLDSSPISLDQRWFLQKKNSRNFFSSSIIFQNNECTGCSQIYSKNFSLYNCNPAFKNIFYLRGGQNLKSGILEKYIVAGCNSGPSVILLGASLKKGVAQAEGIRFKDEQAIAAREAQILACLANVTPPCSYRIERVIIHTSYLMCDIAKEYLRICFRLFVFPAAYNRATFFLNPKACGENNIQFYMPASCRPQRIPNCSTYALLHRNYRSSGQRGTMHEHIKCLRPSPYYSQAFNDSYANGLIDEADMLESDSSEGNEDVDSLEYFIDEPKFKFSRSSLLVVASQNQHKYIRVLGKYLEENAITRDQFDLERLYEASFPQCQRSVWLLTHEISIQGLKGCLADFFQTSQLKPDTITYMPARVTLEVPSSKFTQHVEDMLKSKMNARFKESINFSREKDEFFEKKKSEKKKVTYLKFPNLTLSLYAYMVFQSNQLRPYFISDSELELKN